MIVIIKIERSGGISGITISKEIDVKELPSKLVTIIKKKVNDIESPSLPLRSTQKGAADYYTYRISIQDGSNRKIIECNQYNIQEDLESLIQYLEKEF